jgi:hypothetical protein
MLIKKFMWKKEMEFLRVLAEKLWVDAEFYKSSSNAKCTVDY